jgi:hypothetical protein
MKTKLIIIALASAFTFVMVAQQQRSSPARPPGTVEPDARIVSRLSEIVSIRERIAKNYEDMPRITRTCSQRAEFRATACLWSNWQKRELILHESEACQTPSSPNYRAWLRCMSEG